MADTLPKLTEAERQRAEKRAADYVTFFKDNPAIFQSRAMIDLELLACYIDSRPHTFWERLKYLIGAH